MTLLLAALRTIVPDSGNIQKFMHTHTFESSSLHWQRCSGNCLHWPGSCKKKILIIYNHVEQIYIIRELQQAHIDISKANLLLCVCEEGSWITALNESHWMGIWTKAAHCMTRLLTMKSKSSVTVKWLTVGWHDTFFSSFSLKKNPECFFKISSLWYCVKFLFCFCF